MQAARRAKLELPNTLHGGDLPALFTSMGLTGRRLHGDEWSLQVARPGGRHPDLVISRTIAGPQRPAAIFDSVPNHVDEMPTSNWTPEILERVERLRDDQDSSHFARLRSYQIQSMLAGPEQYGHLVKDVFHDLGRYVIPDTDGTPVFADRSVHLISASTALLRRVKLPSIVLRLTQDPEVLNELTSGTANSDDRGGLVFGAAAEQSYGLILNGAFLGPLLGCLMPYLWAIPAGRLLTTAVIGFGRTIPSTNLRSEDMIDLLPTSFTTPTQTALPPTITAAATESAIDWWVRRLDQMFRYLTDPGVFVDSNSMYLPHEQQHWMLTIEQVLRLTTSTLTGQRDSAGQRVLAFTLLTSFADRLLGPSIDLKKLFKLSYASEKIAAVEATMNTAAAEILLPTANRAVAALQALQDGFFIARQRGTKSVTVHLAAGATKEFNLEDAVARLMVVYRNATHGYGAGARPKSPEAAEINERLLAQHDGKLDADLAFLPYLYLLVVLHEPEATRRSIIDQVAK